MGESLAQHIRDHEGPYYELLLLLDTHRVMNTLQLIRATRGSERTVRDRMQLLQAEGMVDHRRPSTHRGSAPRYWWLLPKGANLIAGTSLARGSPADGGHFYHSAAIAEVWLALRDHGPGAGIELTEWRTDRDGWHSYPATGRHVRNEERTISPDAWFHARLPDGSTTAAFVEVDLNTEKQGELAEKVSRYLAYAQARAWKGIHPHCPPLLLLTSNHRRVSLFLTRCRRTVPDPGDGGLVVAACALVRDPAAAVTEPVWVGLDDATAPIELAELLAERVTARVRDAYQEDVVGARKRHAHRVFQLGHAVGQFHWSAARTHDDGASKTAAAMLQHLIEHHGGAARLLVDEPDLAEDLLTWWGPKDSLYAHRDPVLRQAITATLTGRYRHTWRQQTEAVLAAGERLGADDPAVIGLAHHLTDGDLLDPHVVDELADVEPGRRARLQHDLIAAYEHRRDTDIAATIAGLGRRERRHADPAAHAAQLDATGLLICTRCALRYPQRDAAGDYVPYPHECEHCNGTLTEYPGPPIPPATERLEALRARLADT